MPSFGFRTSLRAFTLIEIIISTALMALIITSAYLCLHAAVASQKVIEPRAEIFQNARVAMALMSADLRCACPLARDLEFLGMHRLLGSAAADNLDFATHNYTPRRPGEGDYCQESLFLEKDPEAASFILYRRRNPAMALDPLAGGTREEIARGLVGLRFEYYDGFDWYDTWGDVDLRNKAQFSRRERYNIAGLPQAVRITLWFDADPKRKLPETAGAPGEVVAGETPNQAPPMVFQTVAQLNLATASQDLSTGSSDSSGQDSSSGPNQGVNQ